MKTKNDEAAHASELMDATGCSINEAASKFRISRSKLWKYRARRGLRTKAIAELFAGAQAAYSVKHRGVTFAHAARTFDVSVGAVLQQWRKIFGDEPTPFQRRPKKKGDT